MTPLNRLLLPAKLDMELDVETQRVLLCVLRVPATGHSSPDFYEFNNPYGWSLLNDDDDAEPVCTLPTIEILTKLGYDTSPLGATEDIVRIDHLSVCCPKEVAALQLAVCDAVVALANLRRSIANLRCSGVNVEIGRGPSGGIMGYHALTQRPGARNGKIIRKLLGDAKSHFV